VSVLQSVVSYAERKNRSSLTCREIPRNGTNHFQEMPCKLLVRATSAPRRDSRGNSRRPATIQHFVFLASCFAGKSRAEAQRRRGNRGETWLCAPRARPFVDSSIRWGQSVPDSRAENRGGTAGGLQQSNTSFSWQVVLRGSPAQRRRGAEETAEKLACAGHERAHSLILTFVGADPISIPRNRFELNNQSDS
jgi:hypothetical protein